MHVPFVDLKRAYAALGSEFDHHILQVAKSGAYVMGKNVAALETAAAEYLGVNHTVAVGSGTDALHLAMAALGIGRDDEVITTSFTFAATVEAIQYVGATAVLVDIDRESMNIDAGLIDNAVTPRTRAILPVHLFGQPADMNRIMTIAEIRGLAVIEDCAQCFGASADGSVAGSFGDAGAFSFYPTKTLGCFGDGGMIATNDTETDRRLRGLRNHGFSDKGEHVTLGFNSRLDELQAAVLRVKLPLTDAMNERRRHIARHYNSVLSEAGVNVPQPGDGIQHVYGNYTICVSNRDTLRKRLREAGIATAVYYDKPLHQHPYFSNTCRFTELPIAERLARQCISLPIFPEMTDAEVDYVATTTARLLT
jgi:dTDP-4-amino-4,6-dideoxygalactose transaminase